MVNDITITSLETIHAFDLLTGNLKFVLDELQDVTIANAQEKTDITGKGGRKLSSLKKNKAVTISGTNGLISGGLMETQVGSSFENKATNVRWQDYLTVSGGKATTNYVAVGTAGNEISAVYVKNTDGTLGSILTQNATASKTGEFAYNTANKELSFFMDGDACEIPDNTEIVVYYNRKIQGDVLENNSDKYSGKVALYVDAMAEDKCSNVYRVQIYVPKADFSGEFSFELGGDQSVHAFEAESLAGACGSGGALWTYTVFGENAADVTA